ATPLLYYQSTNLSMSHSLVFTIVAASLHAAVRLRTRPDRLDQWILLGALAGLCAITRYQAVLGLIPAFWLAFQGWWRLPIARTSQRDWRPIPLLALGAVPFLALQMWAWWRVYGTPLLFTYGEGGESFRWQQPAFTEVLLSPFHGALYW